MEQRQKKPEKTAEEANYYEKVSERFGHVQVVFYLALLLFVVVALISNSQLVTYKNFYYLVKDLNASAETVDVLHTDAVSYAVGDDPDFALFRGGVAAVGKENVTLFTAAGKQSLCKPISFENPTAVGGGKYFLVYDVGNTQFALYNSYSQVYSGKTSGEIRSADVAENGTFAVCSSGEEALSEVTLYNRRFEKLNRYSFDSFVTDISVSPDGKYLSVLTVSSKDGTPFCVLHVYCPGESQANAEVKVGEALGLQCSFTEGNAVTVLFSDRIVTLTANGEIVENHSFSGKELLFADLTKEGSAILLQEDRVFGKKSVIVFDKEGKKLYNDSVADSCEEIAFFDGNLFCRQPDGVLGIRLSDGETEFLSCQTSGGKLLAGNRTGVFLCSLRKATYYRFSL